MTFKNRILLAMLILFLIILGFIENFLFVNINEHLYHLYFGTENSRMSDRLVLLRSWSYDDLMWLKWGMTILSTVLYFIATVAVLNLIFNYRKYVLYTLYLYVAVIALSFIFYMGGSLIGFPNEGYMLSRFAMGFVTSPIPLMALIPAFKLSKRANS